MITEGRHGVVLLELWLSEPKHYNSNSRGEQKHEDETNKPSHEQETVVVKINPMEEGRN